MWKRQEAFVDMNKVYRKIDNGTGGFERQKRLETVQVATVSKKRLQEEAQDNGILHKTGGILRRL